MTPTTKKVLIGFSIFLGISLVGCIIFAIVGATWMRTWFAGAMEQGEASAAEATTFAASHDQNECVQEGLRRMDACAPGEMMCQVTAGLFLQPCLGRATPVAGFCDGVPPLGEIMAGAQWGIAQCTALGHPGNQQCAQLLQGVQRHCAAAH